MKKRKRNKKRLPERRQPRRKLKLRLKRKLKKLKQQDQNLFPVNHPPPALKKTVQ